MGRSIYIDPGKTSNYRWVWEICLSLWVSIGCILTFISGLNLDWQHSSIFSGGMKNGMLVLWNSFAREIGKSDYYLLPQYDTGGTAFGPTLLILAGVLFALTLGVIHTGNRWLLLLYILPYTVALMWTNLTPHFGAVIVLLSGIFATYVYMGDGQNRGSLWALAGVIVLALVFGGVVNAFGTGILHPPASVKQLQSSAEKKIEALRFGEMPLGKGVVSGEERVKNDQSALRISMETPVPLYLRGFVGEEYGSNRWLTLNTKTQFEKRQLDQSLWEKGFHPFSSIAEADLLLDPKGKKQTVSVRVEGGSREYAFTPYEIAEDLIPNTKNVAGSYLSHKAGQSLREYSYQIGPMTIDHWPDQAGRLYAAGDQEDIAEFFHNESYNNVYSYKQYTALSEENAKLIYKELGTSGNQEKGHIDYKLAINNIKKYMDTQITYSEKGWEKSSGNMVEDFFRYKKGYDVHYATVATMMFRYYGIPARYVEGYLLTPAAIKEKNKAGEIIITNEEAHSWTEIYIDGYGWVPIEVCSEYANIMPEPDWTRGLESESYIKPFDRPQQQEIKSGESTVEDKEEEKADGRVLLYIVLILLIMLLLLLLFFITKYVIAFIRRRRAFHGEDPKKALCAIYGFIQKKNWIPEKEDKEILNKAAYSPHPMEDSERNLVLSKLSAMKVRGKAERKRRKANSEE